LDIFFRGFSHYLLDLYRSARTAYGPNRPHNIDRVDFTKHNRRIKMNYKKIAIMSSSLILVLYSACVTPTPDPEVSGTGTAEPTTRSSDPTDVSVVLRIDVENGHSVTFYEPTPGGLFVVERMAPMQKFVLSDKEASDALAAFARLRPEAEIPVTLQAAYDRARKVPSGPVVLAKHAFGGGQPAPAQTSAVTPGIIQEALTSSSSAANFVDNDGGCDWGPTWSFCRVNWGGGFFAFVNPSTSGLCIVDHYAGNGVVVQITAGGTITSTFQGAGTIAQYSLGTPGPSELRRIDITNASGDSFHAGCRWGI
jgi:hypothetical protein